MRYIYAAGDSTNTNEKYAFDSMKPSYSESVCNLETCCFANFFTHNSIDVVLYTCTMRFAVWFFLTRVKILGRYFYKLNICSLKFLIGLKIENTVLYCYFQLDSTLSEIPAYINTYISKLVVLQQIKHAD